MLGTSGLCAAAAWFLVTDEPLLVLLVCLLVLYLCLLDGVLVVAPPPSERNRKLKCFCIGLSRTGTSSISVALHELGYATHHQCHALVKPGPPGAPRRADAFWADALDAHADIAPATGGIFSRHSSARLSMKSPMFSEKAQKRCVRKRWPSRRRAWAREA